jgi:hypothetical protein
LIIRLAVNRRTSLRASLEAGLWTFPRLARLARSKEFSLAKSEDNSGLGEEESVTEREREEISRRVGFCFYWHLASGYLHRGHASSIFSGQKAKLKNNVR